VVRAPWLEVHRGPAPLIVAFPHTGTEIPRELEPRLVAPWLARKDADWWVHLLYDFVPSLGATTVRTAISRTFIDVNRDPSGLSLYPGQPTTDLCPLTTFDGEALYLPGLSPDTAEIRSRRISYFDPYHATLRSEVDRLRHHHGAVVVYDAHSIRSSIPRLFAGQLPQYNIGTHDGASCDRALSGAVEAVCARSTPSHIVNGRFKGGWTTRHYGKPGEGVHALQMELACRSYMPEPLEPPGAHNWPPAYDAVYASQTRGVLKQVLEACVSFVEARER
jgi:N-formylglutamate deformylase